MDLNPDFFREPLKQFQLRGLDRREHVMVVIKRPTNFEDLATNQDPHTSAWTGFVSVGWARDHVSTDAHSKLSIEIESGCIGVLVLGPQDQVQVGGLRLPPAS
jgi:hypothetical protein